MTFLAADVTEITGVKRTRLQQWIDLGFIKPSIQSASGHGSRNLWSREDLSKIAIFKEIAESGLSRKIAADLIEKLASSGQEIISASSIWYVRNGDESNAAIFYPDTDRFEQNLGAVIDAMDFERGSFDNVYIINVERITNSIMFKIKNHRIKNR